MYGKTSEDPVLKATEPVPCDRDVLEGVWVFMKKGSTMSDASKEKMRNAHIGKVPWNKGLHLPGPMTGKKHSPEALEKMRLAKLGNKIRVGMKHTPESILLMSENRKGIPAWNKDKQMPETFCKTMSEVQKGKTIPSHVRDKISMSLKEYEFTPQHRENISKGLMNREVSEETILKLIESHLIGGLWIGNVKYKDPQYCVLWKEVNPRVHKFFDYKCVECGAPENGRSHIGHHVFYVKKACCWYNEEGIYYTNLNAKDHKTHDYCIGENPNYFVILCPKCHGMTGGNFENRKMWADHFKKLIDTRYNGKCYTEKETG